MYTNKQKILTKQNKIQCSQKLPSLPVPDRQYIVSVQFSSVPQSCPTLCDPMNCSTPGLPVHHQLPELAQTHVHWVGDAIQPSHPLSLPSPPAFSLSQHQGLFKWVSSSYQVAKGLLCAPSLTGPFCHRGPFYQLLFLTYLTCELNTVQDTGCREQYCCIPFPLLFWGIFSQKLFYSVSNHLSMTEWTFYIFQSNFSCSEPPYLQFSRSVVSDSWDPKDCRMPGLPVHHQLLGLLKLMSIELVMPSNHLILYYSLLLLPSIFPSVRVFSNESVLPIRWPQSTGVSASAWVFPMNIQD